jgi:ABC-type transporter lipoprotein component MlaA/pimeloyl-ACP methyl ester carboxylesterase
MRISTIKLPYSLSMKSLALVGLTGLLAACSSSNFQRQMVSNPPAGSITPFPDVLNDAGEPLNRGIWEVNEGLLVGVIHPTAKVYRTVVPSRARESIRDFGRNLSYPGRVVNHMLQGRWDGAGDETKRFVANTTVGVAGFFDPATKWNIPKSDANFGQTFGTWGWKQNSYVVLPFFGPSDDRSAVGLVGDKLSEPLSYYSQYNMVSPTVTYNQLTDISEEAKRLLQMEPDPYSSAKIVWSYGKKDGLPDLQLRGPIDLPSLQTFGAANFGPKDNKFLTDRVDFTVKIPNTDRKMKSTYWVQPRPAPLVYIAPGLISHRLSSMSLGIAERLYQNGYSVVTTTSVFHPEFMGSASSVSLPVYPSVDSHDLWTGITEIDRALVKKFPDRFTKRAILGASMGGFMTLRIAASEKDSKSDLISFDRFVAINMPVEISHGFKQLDSYVNIPLKWPEAERQARINNTMHKAGFALLSRNSSANSVMFDGDESKYLIGLSFRVALRDIIYESQSRDNFGVLKTPLSTWRREPVYDEILDYSFNDYFERFAVPYYQKKGISKAKITKDVDLRTYESKLRSQSKIRIIANQNDFLLRSSDVAWLRSTFPASRLTIFPEGGHLGNIGEEKVQKAILKSLDGLK